MMHQVSGTCVNDRVDNEKRVIYSSLLKRESMTHIPSMTHMEEANLCESLVSRSGPFSFIIRNEEKGYSIIMFLAYWM